MAKYDITKTTTTDMTGEVPNFSVAAKTTDGVSESKETLWNNEDFQEHNGYYLTRPELKKAIDAYATWVVGKGFIPEDEETKVILNSVRGWGEDTLGSLLWNMIVVKKYHGDSFAEIVRDPENGDLANLKPLDPSVVTTIVGNNGVILRYEVRSKIKEKDGVKTLQPHEVLHLSNDRVADNIHGTSVVDCVKWAIDARNEAMEDYRRILHRSTIRVMEVDEDDKTRLSQIKGDYAQAIKKGELLLVPKGTQEIRDLSAPQSQHIEWIRYLENFFYQAVGIPKVILGGPEEFTEASSKISYLTYEQIYTREVVDLEADLWNQIGLKIKFTRPASLKNELLDSEEKNTGQVGFQPNDTEAGVGE